jgi:methyl-accepting chemotaxis protein
MLRSVRAKVVALSLSILVAALAANAALNYAVGKRHNDIAISQGLAALASGHAWAISDWIDTRKHMVGVLRDAAVKPDPMPWLSQIVQAGHFANAGVGWADKRYMQTAPMKVKGDFDPTVRPWYRQAMSSNGEVTVTKPYADLASGRLMLAFVVPMIDGGSAKGVTYASVQLDTVKENVASIHPTPNSFGLLVDGDGVIIAYPDNRLLGKSLATEVPQLGAILAAPGESHAVTVDGVRKVAWAEPVHGTDWRLVVVLDAAEANTAMRSQLFSSAIALLIIVLIAALLLSWLTAVTLKRLSAVRDALRDIASGNGDLTLRLPIYGQDEVAGISMAFNQFVEMLFCVMRRVRESSDGVRIAATQIAAGNLDLSGRTEAAAGSVSEIVTSVERIVSMIGRSTEAAAHADAKSRGASDLATKGGEAAMVAIDTMGAIEAASTSIGAITAVIDSIAFQTNILALNASVEAARAGEDGRGFAVVANEVRELAARSAQAAKEIKRLIDGTAGSVERGSAQVRFVGAAVGDIVGSIGKVAAIMSEISVAAREQTLGIEEVERSLSTLDDVIQQNAALVEESAAAADSLRCQADRLSAEVAQFKLE